MAMRHEHGTPVPNRHRESTTPRLKPGACDEQARG